MPINIGAGNISTIKLVDQVAPPPSPAAGSGVLFGKSSGVYYLDSSGNIAGPLNMSRIVDGRLTLTSGTPVTTVDVNNATTVYYTPYIGNMISLYDGTAWYPVIFTEKSIAVGAYTASKPYDIWGYLSSNTLALESTVWTDATNRATALAYQDGVLVKSGDATRRYLGTIYIDADQKTDDSTTKRFVWNYYNRIQKLMSIYGDASHNYTTSTWRPWNNDTSIRGETVVGVREHDSALNIWGNLETAQVAIGYDTTTANSTYTVYNANAGIIYVSTVSAITLNIGYHYYQAVEYGYAGATQGYFHCSMIFPC